MKRFLALLLCALLSLPAHAETLRAFHISTDPRFNLAYAPFCAAYPQVRLKSEFPFYDSRAETTAALLAESYDLLSFSLNEVDFSALIANGVLQPLPDMPLLDTLRPVVRQAITQDGIAYAVPVSMQLGGFTALAEGWQAAGLSMSDLPQSFEELLDFIELWTSQPRPENITFYHCWYEPLYTKGCYISMLTLLLVNCQLLQEEHPNFDTPLFRALLARAVQAGKALYDTSPAINGRYGLFDNCLSSFSYVQMCDGLAYALPLRLTVDQEEIRATAMLTVVAVGASAPDSALSYCQTALSAQANVSSEQEDVFHIVQALLFPGGQISPYKSARWLSDYNRYADTVRVDTTLPTGIFSPLYYPIYRLCEALGAGEITQDAFIAALCALLAP